jgi:exonuclease SbcD
MRILHTSDWHLGQHFMGKTRQAEHAAFIGWLVGQVESHAVDAVIVAGDVFDTGAPPSYARERYNQAVVALHASGAQLVVLGGNHDSVATLGESRALLACLTTHVVPGVCDDIDQQIMVLPTRDGSPGAILCAIPFVRPRDVLQSAAGQSAEDKQLALQAAIQGHYLAVYQKAVERRAALGLPLPIVATGHLTTVGASASESVREIYVGALEAFPTASFPPADYIALGHIHRPQHVGGLAHIRYCGSPIALSFDEARQQKEVLLVDLDESGLRSVTPLAVPCFQPMASISGNLDALACAIAQVAQSGTESLPVWLEVTVTEDDYLADLPGRIQSLCAGLPIELLRVRRGGKGAAARLRTADCVALDELSTAEVFAHRLSLETMDDAMAQQLGELHRGIVSELSGESA